MQPEKETGTAWWRGWWLTALLALPAIYVLGMAPLTALAMRWHAPAWVLNQVNKAGSPLYGAAAHWSWSRDWLNDYRNWWSQKLDAGWFIYPADWNPTPIPGRSSNGH